MDNATQPRAVFMVGGTGAGKSYIRKRDFAGLTVLDSDSIKAEHSDYDPKNPQALHAWSRKILNERFISTIGARINFVYDGTGASAERYVHNIRLAVSLGYHVSICYVKVSLATALRRNANRERVVSESILREKHSLLATSFDIIAPEADEVIVVHND